MHLVKMCSVVKRHLQSSQVGGGGCDTLGGGTGCNTSVAF